MEPQFVISALIGIAALTVGIYGKRYLLCSVLLFLAGVAARYFAYPLRTEDAMWLIGEWLAMALDCIAIAVGLLIGWLIHLLRRHARWVGPDDNAK